MTTPKGQTKTVHRSSVKGQFVTEQFAKSHPKTTEKQRVHINPPPAPKGKGKGK